MDVSIKTLKQNAKAQLKGKWLNAILALLLSGLAMGLSSISGLIPLIIGGAVSVGVGLVFMDIMRGGSGDLNKLLDGFKNSFVNSLIAFLLTAIFVFLWSLLFVIPGIIKTYAYSMTFYILGEHPDMDGREAMKVSERLMKGYKGKLFLLHLSYIGWMLLIPLTAGILAFYVGPWMKNAEVNFYEWVKTQNPQPELGGTAPAAPVSTIPNPEITQ